MYDVRVHVQEHADENVNVYGYVDVLVLLHDFFVDLYFVRGRPF